MIVGTRLLAGRLGMEGQVIVHRGRCVGGRVGGRTRKQGLSRSSLNCIINILLAFVGGRCGGLEIIFFVSSVFDIHVCRKYA